MIVRFMHLQRGSARRASFIALTATLLATSATAQTLLPGNFLSVGPAPTFGDANIAQSRDAPPSNGSLSGAVQAILTNPTNANSIIVGATNGGIWTTQNGGQTWNTTTSSLPSLSIASLAYNSSSSQIVYAGIGNTDNGSIGDRRSGALTGIAVSSDGGSSWSTLTAPLGTMADKSVVSVAGYGTGASTTILAATYEPNSASTATGANNYGLYKSVNGGTFTLVNDGSGTTPRGAATSLVGQGTTSNPYYVVITADTPGQSGVFRSTNGGSTWQPVLSLADNQAGRLAIAPNGAVAVAVFDPRQKSPTVTTGGQIVGLSYSATGASGSWTAISNFPQVNSGAQANTNLTIAIDPNNTNIVYLAGDALANAVTISAYRLTIQGQSGTAIVSQITDAGTSDNSTIHADSRAIAFDALGRLLMASDGGIYARTNPQSSAGGWSGLNGNLSLREAYVIAYDSISKRLAVAAQDTGVALQNTTGATVYSPVNGGDGFVAAVNDHTYASQGESILYTSSQGLGGLRRIIMNSQGMASSDLAVDPSAGNPGWNFVNKPTSAPTATDFTNEIDTDPNNNQLPMATRFVLNRIDPTKIAIGSNYLYVTTDDLVTKAINGDTSVCSGTTTTVCNILTNVSGLSTLNGAVTAVAYGASGNENALLAGTDGTANNRLYYSGTAAANSLAVKSAYAGGAPTSLLFGVNSSVFYVADGNNLWSSINGGTSFTDLTSNLSSVANNLSVGSPMALEFLNTTNNVKALLVGGLFTGAAGASRTPIAVAMSDNSGNLSGWSPFGINLPNTFVSYLTYNTSADVLAASLYGRGIWLVYDVTSYFSSATELWFGKADNDSTPVASQLGGSRPLIKFGTGTLTINVDTAYTGTTTIKNGTLLANASMASSSSMMVEEPATVRGIGILPQTTIAGTLRPGNNAIGTITVNKGLTFNAGSTYAVDVSPQVASSTNVVAAGGTGAAELNGTVQAILQPGNYVPSRTFTILNAVGGLNGSEFANVTSNFPFLGASLSYDASNAYLTIAPGGFASGGQTANQVAVGSALDRGVAGASGDYATVIGALSLMSSSQAPAAFDAISGVNYAGFATLAVRGAQLFMNNFAQQIGGSQTVGGGGGSGSAGNNGGSGGRIALAEACDASCDIPAAPRWGVWGGGVGATGALAGSATTYGTNFSIGGFSGGLDYRFDPQFLAGVTVGYTNASQYTQGLAGSGNSNTVQLGLYSTLSYDPFYLDLLAGYARSANTQVRQISIPGLATRTANGQTTLDQFFGQVEVGRRIDLGGQAESFVTPFARLQGSTATSAAFSEWGAQSLDLNVAAQTTNSLRTILGAQLGGKLDAGGQGKLALVLRAGWSHEYASTNQPVTASFAGAPVVPFTVQGASAPRDGVVVGLAATTALTDSTSLYARYDGDLAGGNTSHVFSAGVRYVW
ncbi:autotransporter domain-containing protein [Enhydrobacter aerosaccus]|nr:autotransporter domain-containing protein [Enhydrobacter aerosaccus]